MGDFCSLSKTEQVKHMAYIYVKVYGDEVFTAKNIDKYFVLSHLQAPTNTYQHFKELLIDNVFIKYKYGYVFQRDAFRNLEKEFSESKPKRKISKTLRGLLSKIKDKNKIIFLEEAVSCYEIKAYRASIILTWLLVMDHIHEYVFNKKLSEFNVALSKQKLKIKNIKKKDDFLELKESKFIEICRSASIITGDSKKILDEKLGIRNSCAHPNDVIIKESKATNYIEDLIHNIISKYN